MTSRTLNTGTTTPWILALSLVAVSLLPAHASLVPPRDYTTSASERIRVRIAEAVSMVSIRGYDLRIRGAGPNARVHELSQASRWEFRCQDDRIRAVPGDGGKTLDLVAPVEVSTPAGLLNYRDRPYRDLLRVTPMGSLCEVVNELDIEKYLSGLVNAEFNSSWGEQATEAQVVAARTYAFHQIREVRASDPERHFDVDATVRDQVYDGYIHEDSHGSRAVERTRGMVLMVPVRGKLQPMKAFYHSTCAGRTELPEQVWGKAVPGFHHGVTCPYCARSPKIRWNAALSGREIADALLRGAHADGKVRGWPSGWVSALQSGQLLELRPIRRDSSDRWSELETVWSNGGRAVALSISGAKLREWVGPSRLKSTMFDISNQGGLWKFVGRGNGHGVGLCQYGAKAMGEQGYAMASILKQYYPDAILRKLW